MKIAEKRHRKHVKKCENINFNTSSAFGITGCDEVNPCRARAVTI
jgi:hypothetical protein